MIKTMGKNAEMLNQFSSVQFSSVAQLCSTLCNPTDCSTPGFPEPGKIVKHSPSLRSKTGAMESRFYFFIIIAYIHSGILSRERFVWDSCSLTHSPCGLQHARLPCPSLSPRVCSNSCPLSGWCYPTNHLILCCPLLLLPSIFQDLIQLIGSSHQVAKELELQLQH